MISFGRIELFTIYSTVEAFVKMIDSTETSLFDHVGPPCRPQLAQYQDADILSQYIVPVSLPTEHTPLTIIPITSIVSKINITSNQHNHFCIMQPNNFEQH